MIDVWNPETFDDDLFATLRANASLIRDYLVTEKRIFLEQEALDHWTPRPSNPHHTSYSSLLEQIIMPILEARTIRAWHYTRLTDGEVQAIRDSGVHVSMFEAIRRRLDAQVAASAFSSDVAERLYAASPAHSAEQQPGRLGKFWMTSHPLACDNHGVELLLENWGGECVYFWLRDEDLKRAVASLGKPRILEVAVPLEATNEAYSAAKATVGSFARTLGCDPDFSLFDLYTKRPLAPDAVLKIHTEGEAGFGAIGRNYPAGLASVS